MTAAVANHFSCCRCSRSARRKRSTVATTAATIDAKSVPTPTSRATVSGPSARSIPIGFSTGIAPTPSAGASEIATIAVAIPPLAT